MRSLAFYTLQQAAHVSQSFFLRSDGPECQQWEFVPQTRKCKILGIWGRGTVMFQRQENWIGPSCSRV